MNIRDVQLAEMAVAKHFIDICSANDFEYVALGGTVLGAIRHKGFIPWDDDLDFGLIRSDYDEFRERVLNNPDSDFIVRDFTVGNNHDYPMKLESTRLEIIDDSKEKTVIKHPWVDIFPIDGMPDSTVGYKMHGWNLLVARALFKLSQLHENVSVENPNRTTIERVIISLGKFLPLDKILSERRMFSHLDKVMRAYGSDTSTKLINFMGAYKLRESFPRAYYTDTVLKTFEDIKIRVPRDYDKYLSQMYGDYLQLPPEADRNKHKTVVK